MERFFNEDENNPEFQFQDDTFEDIEDLEEEGAIAYIDKHDLFEVMHMDIAQSELTNDVLGKAIDIAQKEFFWGFRSTKYKMKQIELIYHRLMQISSGYNEEGE